jgi:hypothetical protein
VTVTAPGQSARLLQPGGDDSWKPMARADAYYKEHANRDLYGVFFDEKVKFQYPPSALFFWDLFPASLYGGEGSVGNGGALRTVLTAATLAAVLLTIAASTWILMLGLRHAGLDPRHGGTTSRLGTIAVIAIAFLLGLTYYPLNKAHSGGQIQVFLDLLVAAALLAHMKGARATAGICIGVCSLAKPQYVIVLVSGLLRRNWRLALPMAAVGALGLAAAVMAFGFHNHLRYVEVLGDISSHGETYWPNQSVNGLMNRLLGNGKAETFSMDSFPPYHPVVYYTTLVSSAIILIVSLWPGRLRRSHPGGNIVDLALALMAATMASPVAWEHHYGTFLPIFAVMLPVLMRERPAGAWTGPLLLVSYVAMANVVRLPERMFWNPWRGLAGSHLFFGALILLALCIAVRRGMLKQTQSVA